ncbi:MAG: hypothetical protein ABIY37_08070, partial [Devosia sp.]
MRLSAIILVLAGTLSPALAADSIADQAQEAFSVFAGGQSQMDFNTARYGSVGLRNVAGKWVALSGPAAGTGIETYGTDTEKFCKGAGAVTLASP